MPIYEYECSKCKTQFELLVKASEAKDPNWSAMCPFCGTDDELYVTKLISQSDFVLKGGGWAKDSYGLGKKR